MKLYHGTSGRFLSSILKDGLKPRGVGKKGNWKHTVESNPRCVYFTDSYAPYFTAQATKGNYPGIVVEVDTDLLPNPMALLPDEDVLEQAWRGYDDVKGEMLERTKWYRKNIFRWTDGESWKKSLEVMGTCSYYKEVTAKAISRIAVIPKEQLGAIGMWWDASITIVNYRILGEAYKAKTRRLFGDPVEAQPAHTFNDPRIPVKDMRILNLFMGRVVSEQTFSLPDERDTKMMMALLDEARKEEVQP